MRFSDVNTALRLEWLTLAWMIVEAVIAIGSGVSAHSLVLQAFGADSVIELVSAGVLVWRLRVELQSQGSFPEHVERRASRIGGALLFALCAYVTIGAIHSLWTHQGQTFTKAGLAVTAAAIPIMYGLAKSKLRMADRLGSRALRADAMESLTCGYLSVVVVVALLAQLFVGAWWVCAASALVLVPFLLREARAAW
ncbi:MAG TPA: cation transporter, partial [Polyangiaceae bacterium]|nr:cation transporter [Polyangiaceae bacterium]